MSVPNGNGSEKMAIEKPPAENSSKNKRKQTIVVKSLKPTIEDNCRGSVREALLIEWRKIEERRRKEKLRDQEMWIEPHERAPPPLAIPTFRAFTAPTTKAAAAPKAETTPPVVTRPQAVPVRKDETTPVSVPKPETPPVPQAKEIGAKREMGKIQRGLIHKLWNTRHPVYEIINIEFEDEDEEEPSATPSGGKEAKRDEKEEVEIDDPDAEQRQISIMIYDGDAPEEVKETPAVTEDSNKVKEEMEVASSTKPVKWPCVECKEGSQQIFRDYDSLREHYEFKHPPSISKNCQLCRDPNKLVRSNLFEHHVACHLQSSRCDLCTMEFSTKEEYEMHRYRKHARDDAIAIHDSGEIVCLDCEQSFSTYQRLVAHFQSKKAHKKPPTTCPTSKCQRFRSNHQNFLDHLFLFHMQCTFSCAVSDCGYTSASPFVVLKHAKRHSPEFVARECGICRRKITNQAVYEAHVKSHANDPERAHKCDICGNAFLRPDTLAVHRRRHFAEEKKFGCNFCDKRFYTVHLKNVHERIHTNSRPFLCRHCPKKFRSSNKLALHERRHLNSGLYKCQYCNCLPAFHSIGALNRHLQSKHNNKDVVLRTPSDKEPAPAASSSKK